LDDWAIGRFGAGKSKEKFQGFHLTS
jgi:hypothetical protein